MIARRQPHRLRRTRRLWRDQPADGDDRNATFDIYTIPAPQAAPAAFSAQAATATIARLTTSGNVSDPAWGRAANNPPPAKVTLTTTVDTVGSGVAGFVVSWPPGILCGRDCRERVRTGTVVTLVAVPNLRSKFAGWSGACAGSSLVCIVTMSDSKNVGAKFVRRR